MLVALSKNQQHMGKRYIEGTVLLFLVGRQRCNGAMLFNYLFDKQACLKL